MNRFKSILSILLCFTMLIAFSNVSVFAATTIEYEDFTLAVNGDNTYSAYKYNGNSSYVAIPEEVDGMPIVAISSYCFEDSNAEYILLTNNIKTIYDYAFYGAEKLLSVAIPATVTSIGNGAFANCPLLTGVEFAKNIKIDTFSSGLFQGCAGIKSIEIPTSVKTIKSNFVSGTSIENIVIPDTVTSLGASAFENCTSLTSVKLSSKLKALGAYTFSGCTALESVAIPEGITSIGNRCFYNCSALSDVSIPLTCESMGIKVFYNCTSLSSVFIPRNITSIGADCFSPMNFQKKIVLNGFKNTYVQEYSYANGTDFSELDANIGDANYDSDVDINDVTAIQKHLAKISILEGSLKMSYADSNKDGKLSIRDATCIQMYIAKYIDEF